MFTGDTHEGKLVEVKDFSPHKAKTFLTITGLRIMGTHVGILTCTHVQVSSCL